MAFLPIIPPTPSKFLRGVLFVSGLLCVALAILTSAVTDYRANPVFPVLIGGSLMLASVRRLQKPHNGPDQAKIPADTTRLANQSSASTDFAADLAVSSLLFGLLSIFVNTLFAIAAIVAGIVATVKGEIKGVVGIVLGGIGVAVWFLLASILSELKP
jgi:hypothetical protein